MNFKVFIGGLPWATTDADLKAYFMSAGDVVSARVVMDKMTGRSRGFGFVEYASQAEMEKAVNTLNNTDLGGRVIIVNEAKPEAPRAPRSTYGGESSYGNR